VALDSDDEKFKSSRGVEAKRDIVQFVPLNKFLGPRGGGCPVADSGRLAAETLAELPAQMLGYFNTNHIVPRKRNKGVISTDTAGQAAAAAALSRQAGTSFSTVQQEAAARSFTAQKLREAAESPYGDTPYGKVEHWTSNPTPPSDPQARLLWDKAKLALRPDPRLLNVEVPAGLTGGQTFLMETPSGSHLVVRVPRGAETGHVLQVLPPGGAAAEEAAGGGAGGGGASRRPSEVQRQGSNPLLATAGKELIRATVVVATAPPLEPAAPGGGGGGGSDWVPVTDPGTGKTYYANKATGATSWINPAAPPSAPPPPEEWIAVQDPSGKTYYYNAATGQTSWTKPI